MLDHHMIHIHSSSLSTKTQRPVEHDHHDHLYQQERNKESDLIKHFTRPDLETQILENLQNHIIKTRRNLIGRIVPRKFQV
jgi:hypothetical protein